MTASQTDQLSIAAARDHLLRQASAQGTELEVYALRDNATSIKAFSGTVSEFKVQARQGVGLRVLVRGAWGSSFTENLSQPALDRALRDAIDNAELVEPEAGAVLVAWGEPPSVDLYGEGLSGVSVQQKMQVALKLEQAVRDTDARVTSLPYGGYMDNDQEVLVGNTQGLRRDQRSLYAMTYAYPLVAEDGQHKMSGDWQFSREFAELDPTRTAQTAVANAVALLGARPAPSGAVPAVVSGDCFAQLLALFSPMFNGQMIEENKSPLVGRVGEAIASPLLTLVDDATLLRGLNSRAFDVEGCPSVPLTLIDQGRLSAFMHNAQTAARAGTHSTGHASRFGYQGTVMVGYSNLKVQPGQTPAADLMAGLTGVHLTNVRGGHAGAHPMTGDFSLQAEGFWVQDGVVAYPLEVFTVAGNMLELMSSVQAVGDELEWTQYSVAAPSVRIPEIMLGGSV